MKELQNDWYESLVTDCKAIITEAVFTSRWALVEGYWSLGKRIREENNLKRSDIYGKKILTGLSKSIGVGERDLYRAIQAYDKFKELDKIPEGKNISWNKLVTKYLPERKVERKIITAEHLTPKVIHGDFRKVNLKADSFDLILTDPPYPKQYLPLWLDVAKCAMKVLKPGGWFIAYSGNLYLPEVFKLIEKGGLSYYWMGVVYHTGKIGQRFEVNMFNRAKPILFYYKPPLKKQELWIEDVLESDGADKDFHEWGQSTGPLEKLITTFCPSGGSVLDPFVGGGATLEAASKTSVYSTGIEIDKDVYSKLVKRL